MKETNTVSCDLQYECIIINERFSVCCIGSVYFELSVILERFITTCLQRWCKETNKPHHFIFRNISYSQKNFLE